MADSYDGSDRRKRQKERWHVRKEISVTHIIATITFILAGVAAYYDLREADQTLGNNLILLQEDLVHTKELQYERDTNQNGEIAKIYVQIEDARQEFRDEHDRTRREVLTEQRETRSLITTMYKQAIERSK